MKFVHSFWSKPLFENKFNTKENLLPVILHDYAYSVACLKNLGQEIRLVADKEGAELLGFLPYDSITIVDHADWSVNFAAQIKFEALKCMELDECLIDGDLFIQKKESVERINSLNQDLVYSLYEPNDYILNSPTNCDRYVFLLDVFKKHSSEFKSPYVLDRFINDLSWPNTSFMKFNNIELKQEYIRQYEHFKSVLEHEQYGGTWPDILIEQRHMDKLLKTGYSSAPIIEDFPTNKSNDYALSIGFTHLGFAKIALDQMVTTQLQSLNPELFAATEEHIKQLSTPSQ